MGTPYHYNPNTSNFYDELRNMPIIHYYEDTLRPILVPPEPELIPQLIYSDDDDLRPQLVPPEPELRPRLVPPSRVPLHRLHRSRMNRVERPRSPPRIEIIEVPVEVLVEVPVEVRVEVPARNQESLPQYILNGYIENMVTKKETCPILMTELALDTTCITPCGHAMSKEGLDSWFQTSQTCPVCRTPFSQDQLQIWK